MVLLQDNSVKVEFDSSVPCIIWTPIEYMEGEKFRDPFSVGINYMETKIKELPNLGWLNDARKLKSVKIDDTKWLNQNVNDRAYKFGAKKVAFVLPENIFGKMAIKLYVEFTNKRSDNKLEIKAFNTIDKARLWLKNTNNISVEEVKL